MKKYILPIALFLLAALPAAAQKDFGSARFDRTVYDFGKINTKDGAVSCSFEVSNIGDKPLNIFAVITTCGCTSVKWTRTDIAPGAKGTPSFLPSGVFPVFLPYTTLEVIVKIDIVGIEPLYV